MRKSLSKSVIVGAFVLVAMGVAGCGSSGNGGTGTGSSETSNAAAPTTSAAAAIDPCELLKPADMTKLGVEGPGEAGRTAGAPMCDFDLAVGGVSVVVHSDRSVDQLNDGDGKAEKTSVAGMDAKIVREVVGPGDCGIALATSSTTAVSLDVTSSDTEAACKVAQQAAPLVAANLPQS